MLGALLRRAASTKNGHCPAARRVVFKNAQSLRLEDGFSGQATS